MDYTAVIIKPNAKITVLGRKERWCGSKQVFVARPLQMPEGYLLLKCEGWPDIAVDADDTFDVTETGELT
jgi:hypothetical protein